VDRQPQPGSRRWVLVVAHPGSGFTLLFEALLIGPNEGRPAVAAVTRNPEDRRALGPRPEPSPVEAQWPRFGADLVGDLRESLRAGPPVLTGVLDSYRPDP
jgi:hypothetical protein